MRLLFILFFILSPFIANASDNYAIGVAIGEPSGLSGFMKLDNDHALQTEISAKYLTGEYLIKHDFNFGYNEISWYFGGGVSAGKNLGARAATSIIYDIINTPFHIYTNASFNFFFNNSSNLGLSVGGRFNF